MSWADSTRGYEGESTHPRMHAVEDTRGERRQRSRTFVVTVVLSCLFVAFVAVAAILSSLHSPTTPTSAAPRVTTRPAVSSLAVSRMLAATDAADTAISTTRAGLDQLTGIPTTSDVSALINPYVESLWHYGAVLARTSVPTAAKATAASAHALVNKDVRFTSTIDGLPSLALGTYLEQFGRNATQLQKTLEVLEGELSTSTN